MTAAQNPHNTAHSPMPLDDLLNHSVELPKTAANRDLHNAEWDLLQLRWRTEFGDANFKQWFAELKPEGVKLGVLHITAANHIVQHWVATQAQSRMMLILRQICPDIDALHIAAPANQNPFADIAPPTSATSQSREDDELGAQLDPRFTFDSFVVGKPNELAFAAARRVAENDSVQFNPLFLYGGVGLGKTHLMHAIAWGIRERNPHRRVVYLSAEKFMYKFIRALRFKDTMSFKEQFRNVDVLMIDDVQFISGKDSTQEEFFHTFNALVDQNRQIIVSADKSPSDLAGMEERLKSRLGWGLVADIHPTSYELRLGILQTKAERSRVHVPLNVLEFLAHKITSNVRELEGSFNRIVAHADLVGRPITLETTQDVLYDLLRNFDRRLSIDDIQRRVCEHFAIKLQDLLGDRRNRQLARPRQVAMYLAKTLTTKSLPDIGRSFGGRDHTTVLHAVRKIEALMTEDPSMQEDIDLLLRSLKQVG